MKRINVLSGSLVVLVLFAIVNPAEAGKVWQVTEQKTVSFDWPMPNGDGSEIFIATSADVGGENPQHRFQIVSYDPVTLIGTPLISLPGSLTHIRHNLSVTEDGQWFAFVSNGDLVPGQNGDRSDEAFAIRRDGTGLTQLSNVTTSYGGAVTRIAMAGTADRVAFVTSADLTGGNPQRAHQVFVVKRDGTGLTQVTNAPNGSIGHMWISDDGTRLAFNGSGNPTGGNADGNSEVFVITVGDALPRQITSSTTGAANDANVSGDGSTIVFASSANYTGGNADGGHEIFKADWTTGTITQVTTSPSATRTSHQPWPTNTGGKFFFSSDRQSAFEVWSVNANGTGLTRLSGLNFNPGCEHPVVSGNGSRYGVWLAAGLYTGTTAGTEVALINRVIVNQGYLDVSANGQKVAFLSPLDPLGSNPQQLTQIYVSNIDGTGLRQLTSVEGSDFVVRPAISGDGSRVYFDSNADFLGANPDHNNEVFGINSDGTGLMQYTNCGGPGTGIFSGYAAVSDDGNTIVFMSLCNLTGGNPTPTTAPLFKIDKFGNGLTQLFSFPASGSGTTYAYYPRLDATGTWLSFTGNANIAGGNPENNYEVWRMKTDGTSLVQITSTTTHNTFRSDMSADGTKVVFAHTGNPLGTNADGNNEVFLYQAGGSPQLRQLTATTKGEQASTRLSGDGRYVYFQSDSELLENDPDHAFRSMYRYDLTTSTLERSGGSKSEHLGNPVASLTQGAGLWPMEVNHDGSVVGYVTFSDSIGKNPDEYWDFMTLDYNAPNPPVVSPHSAPTTITFEPEPGIVAYDVIRGSLASLQMAGSTADLGAVVCVENDSGDSTTAGDPDPDTPASGQGFFYVFRGAMSSTTGEGSYGTSRSGNERLAASGDCASEETAQAQAARLTGEASNELPACHDHRRYGGVEQLSAGDGWTAPEPAKASPPSFECPRVARAELFTSPPEP